MTPPAVSSTPADDEPRNDPASAGPETPPGSDLDDGEPSGWPELNLPTAGGPVEPSTEPDQMPHTAAWPRVPAYIIPAFERVEPTAAAPEPGRSDTSAGGTDAPGDPVNRPPAAVEGPPAAAPSTDGEPPQRQAESGGAPVVAPARSRSRLAVGLLLGLTLAVLVVLVSVSLVSLSIGSDRQPRTTGTPPAGTPASVDPSRNPGTVVTGPRGTTEAAEFQLVQGVTSVVVRVADLGDQLFRATTPEESGFVPVVARDDARVQLQLSRVRDGVVPDSVTVELSTGVRWKISMIGGSESATLDLRGADVSGVDFVGGVARIETWLPKPQGVVPVGMSGGAREFIIHAPGQVPVTVSFGRGAAKLSIDGQVRAGIASGSRFASIGWNDAPDRYGVDASAGVDTLTIDRY